MGETAIGNDESISDALVISLGVMLLLIHPSSDSND
jgi:hypothetical protein